MHVSTRTIAIASLVSVAAIWGIASVVIKSTLEYLPPMTFLYYRFVMILPITIPWYIYYVYKNPIRKKDIVPLTIFSLMATTVYLSLVFWGFERTTAIDGNLLGTLTPIMILLLGMVFLKERVSVKERLGVVVVLIGALVTVIQPFLEGKAFALENSFGNTLLLIGAGVWALFVLYSKKNVTHFSPVLITLHGSIVAALTYPLLAYVENGFHLPNILELGTNPGAFWGVFYMAFISYVLAYILYEFGMSKIEISEGSLFTYLQPLFATPLAVLFLGEQVTVFFLLGAFIIFSGVVLSEWK